MIHLWPWDFFIVNHLKLEHFGYNALPAKFTKGARTLTEYLTEQEQIEVLKNWIKQYSPAVIAGVAIAMIAAWGWHFWQQREAKIQTHASTNYDELITLRAQNNVTGANQQAQKILTHYPKTPYSTVAAFMLARNAVLQKNYPEADKQLNWVIDNSRDPAFKQIARIRLARTLIEQNKASDSLKVLATVDDKSFLGLIDEVKGDAYVSLHQPQQARTAYQAALTELPNAETMRPILQMKYDSV